MFKKTLNYVQIFIATFAVALALPVISSGDDTGRDWYCSEPEAHALYEKHLKTHLVNDAEVITNELEKIFSDSSLTPEQKHSKTHHILNKYLSEINAGIGD